jgi:Mn-containing catalase
MSAFIKVLLFELAAARYCLQEFNMQHASAYGDAGSEYTTDEIAHIILFLKATSCSTHNVPHLCRRQVAAVLHTCVPTTVMVRAAGPCKR